MTDLTSLLVERLPPESGPILGAPPDWWELVSRVALLLAVAVLLACLGFIVGFFWGGEG